MRLKKYKLVFGYYPVEKGSKMVIKDQYVFLVDNKGNALSDDVDGKLTNRIELVDGYN